MFKETFPGGRSLPSVILVPCSLPWSPGVHRPGLAPIYILHFSSKSHFLQYHFDLSTCTLPFLCLKKPHCRVSRRQPHQRGSLTAEMRERRIEDQDHHQHHHHYYHHHHHHHHNAGETDISMWGCSETSSQHSHNWRYDDNKNKNINNNDNDDDILTRTSRDVGTL